MWCKRPNDDESYGLVYYQKIFSSIEEAFVASCVRNVLRLYKVKENIVQKKYDSAVVLRRV